MIIFISTILAYFSIIFIICLYLKHEHEHEHKTKITHNPYYGFWFNFTIMTIIPLLPLFMIRNHFNKPPKTIKNSFNSTDDFSDAIKEYMGSDTKWMVELSAMKVKITINRDSFLNGFDRKLEMLKAHVHKNVPPRMTVEWFVKGFNND